MASPRGSNSQQYDNLTNDEFASEASLRLNEPKRDSLWAQQRIPAWNPVRSNTCVTVCFLITAILFLITGVLILEVANTQVVEVEHRYDNLSKAGCDRQNCQIELSLNVVREMKAPIYIYYKLVDYYQNHRIYAQSRQDDQLHGALTTDLSSCYPLKKWGGKFLYPCGLIANSFFNDTFSAQVCTDGKCVDAGWRANNITWTTDHNEKYHTRKLRPDIETNVGPNGFALPGPGEEEMIVWLRVASMSTFKKLHRVIENQSLKPGQVVKFTVNSIYPANEFQKWVVLATTSPLGASQSVLAYVFIIIGVLLIIVVMVYYFMQKKVKPNHKMYFFDTHVD